MAEIKFDVLNARVTFKNVPLHSLARFAFKDINAATNAFKKIPGVEECIIIQTSSRVEIFTVSNLETGDETDFVMLTLKRNNSKAKPMTICISSDPEMNSSGYIRGDIELASDER